MTEDSPTYLHLLMVRPSSSGPMSTLDLYSEEYIGVPGETYTGEDDLPTLEELLYVLEDAEDRALRDGNDSPFASRLENLRKALT